MTSRPTRFRVPLAILAGMLLLLTGVAAASAVSAEAGIFRAGDGDRSSRVNIGAVERQTLDLSFGSLTPGGAVRARRVLGNDESRSIRYSLASASSDDDRKGMRDVIDVTIRTADLGSGDDGTCARFDGSVMYVGPLGAGAAGFGSARMGDQPGDRFIAAGGQETLCFEMRMTLAAGNEHQAAKTRTHWTIAAEQVAGNP